MGWNETQLKEQEDTFDMIMNGEVSGYDKVTVLGVPGNAIFWKQWIDAENITNRLSHISQLNNIWTLNSDRDTNVPPFAYQPLHDIVDGIAANPYCNLHASMNVIPNMIHVMFYVYDTEPYKVSQDVIDLIGSWVNSIMDMDGLQIYPYCLEHVLTTSTPTRIPTSDPTIEPTIIPTQSPIENGSDGKRSVGDMILGVLTIIEIVSFVSFVHSHLFVVFLVFKNKMLLYLLFYFYVDRYSLKGELFILILALQIIYSDYLQIKYLIYILFKSIDNNGKS